MNASDYGRFYWTVTLTNGDVVTFYADEVQVTQNGDLLAFNHGFGTNAEGERIVVSNSELGVKFAVAAGQWAHFAAADNEDGHRVAVENWNQQPLRMMYE